MSKAWYRLRTEIEAETMTSAVATISNALPRLADETDLPRPVHDAEAYRDILAKHDDHLIRDIGRTREDLLGSAKAFWAEWLKQKTPWQL
jgi:hypothetical protein